MKVVKKYAIDVDKMLVFYLSSTRLISVTLPISVIVQQNELPANKLDSKRSNLFESCLTKFPHFIFGYGVC